MIRSQPAGAGYVPLLAGDRINGSGSRLVRRLLLAGDDGGVVRVAREQIAAGVQALDVCAAVAGVAGEAERLMRLVALLARQTDVPLLIDSADPNALIAGLRASGGRRAIVNSVNLIDRKRGLDCILPVAVQRGDGVIAQTIDVHGAAVTADEKLRLATGLVQILTREYGLATASIWIDPVLLPLAHAPDGAAGTLAALRRIKVELPGVRTALAVSNLSFGLPPGRRPALSRDFLRAATEAGLDLAVVNPAHLPQDRAGTGMSPACGRPAG